MDIAETLHEFMRWIHLARRKFRADTCRNVNDTSCSLKSSNALVVITLKTINCYIDNYSEIFLQTYLSNCPSDIC